MNGPCHIQLFGTLRVQQGERLISRFRTQQTGALLAYLAYHRQSSHSRESLLELCWPQSEPEAGRHKLSNALSSLRAQLEPPGIPGGSVLIADRFSVELNPDAVTTDVAAFEQALRRAAQSRTTPNYVQALTEAAESYGGRLLPHYYEDWIAPEQERLQQRFQQTVSQLLGLLEKAGEFERALEWARRSLSIDPLREEAHQDVMRLLAAGGQPAEALRQYRELERLFSQELGETPSSAAQQLARQIETQAASAPTPLPTPSIAPALSLCEISAPFRLTGTVTFLLTDIEGSTALWEKTGEVFRSALTSHHALLRAEFRRNGGQEVKEAGDSFLVAFAGAGDGLSCAIACQQALAAQPWPEAIGSLKVRMALHTGDVEREDGEYHGLVLHRAARMLAAAHGGQILVSEATAGLLRRDLEPGTSLKDLGVWRLRDVEAPERLFQVETARQERQEFPPLNAEPAHSARLPLQFTRFFGRTEEIANIAQRLQSPETRLLTLTGPGGTGKTRLAIEAVSKFGETFPGGIWFVPLADISDPGLIGSEIVGALGIPRTGQVEPLEQAAAALAKQPSLLILDNFEQLVEGGAEIVQMLLERLPALQCLVTSRQRLGVSGEQEFAVSLLPTPNGADTPERLSLFESVRLFVDRAQVSAQDFQLTNHNGPAVAELCDRLEGLPLAIELAAARIQVMTPAQMLVQLSRRFEFLVSRKRGVAERQRTLRAAVDWSYKLLSSELQQFFAQLSVFRGGWTVEAAEVVCDEPLALDYLAQLREGSLILTEESDSGIRFRMLETLREYAEETLLREERAILLRRHRDYFQRFAQEGKQGIESLELERWARALEMEQDNLRQALAFCLETPEEAMTGMAMATSLQRFWNFRVYWREGRERLAAFLAHPETQEPAEARGSALSHASELAGSQGDQLAARALLEEALEIARKLDNRVGIANTLHALGVTVRWLMDWDLSKSLLLESLAIRRILGDREGIAGSLRWLGNLACDQGDYPTARRWYEEHLALRREIGDKVEIAHALGRLSELSYLAGDPDTGKSLAEEILTMHQGLGDKRGIAGALGRLGRWDDSLPIQRDMGNRAGVANDLMHLGCVANNAGDFEAARAYHLERIEIWRELDNSHQLAWALMDLGHVSENQGDFATAHKLYAESLSIYSSERGNWSPVGTTHFLESSARMNAKEGQWEKAARLWGASEVLHEQIQWVMLFMYREEYAHWVTKTQEALGQEAFSAAWAKGRAMSWEQAIGYALGERA